MKNYIKNWFVENNYAKFMASGLGFMWLACFLALVDTPAPMIFGCGLTSAVLGISAICSGIKQHG